MLRYIFKNYDKFLETIHNKIANLFNIKKQTETDSLQLKPIDIIELEIKKQEENLKQKDNIEQKLDVIKNILYLYLKRKSLKTANRYIKRAEEILEDEMEDTIYEALSYLKRVPKDLESEQLREIYIFKAYLYELLEDFSEASKEYKQAIKYDKTPNTLVEFKKFIERSRDVISWEKDLKRQSKKYNIVNIHNITKIEDMPEVAEKLESVAKYYARSPKSRTLGKKYFREVLKMYKTLSQKYPKDYTCKYTSSLMDAVELFMMPPSLLRDSLDILLTSEDCNDLKIHLLKRLKDLKDKSFIKKSRVFEK